MLTHCFTWIVPFQNLVFWEICGKSVQQLFPRQIYVVGANRTNNQADFSTLEVTDFFYCSKTG
jgi:hypothetical protein